MLQALIADDHEIVRLGIKRILREEYPSAHVEEANDTSTLIDKACNGKWDIILSDLSMPGGGGLHALEKICKQVPAVPVLIVSIYPEEQYGLKVIKAGASGYINKDALTEELVNAVETLLSGKKYFSETTTKEVVAPVTISEGPLPHELLEEKERTVFDLIITGNTVTGIADHLAVSIAAAATYRSEVFRKLNVRNNWELVQYANEKGLI